MEIFLWLYVADAAMVTAISEINYQADPQPDEQPGPVDPAEFVHHVAVEEDAENRNDRDPRRPESPRLAGIRLSQNHHCNANNDKGQHRADLDTLSVLIAGFTAAN